METDRTLSTDRTHLFPGARLFPDGPEPTTVEEVVVLFSDGARAEGAVAPASQGLLLNVEEYRTAAGTRVPAKRWELTTDADGTLRVTRPAAR